MEIKKKKKYDNIIGCLTQLFVDSLNFANTLKEFP